MRSHTIVRRESHRGAGKRGIWLIPLLALAQAVPGRTAAPGELPLVFVESAGAESGTAAFTAHAVDLTARFEPEGVSFSWRGSPVRLTFPGAAEGLAVEGAGEQPGRASWFQGGDSRNWLVNARLYEGVWYRGIYPGIDMKWAGSGRRLKSEFVVQPGADPGRIRLKYSAAGRIGIAADGSLEIETTGGLLRESAPEVYQLKESLRIPVESRYVLAADGSVGFVLGAYDPDAPLVIDPTVSFSTPLGGQRSENATAAAVDGAGNIYVAGWSDSVDFPVAQPVRAGGGGVDAFLVKFNPTGTKVLFATYLGGSGDDRALALAVDEAGNAYLAGTTTSANFPLASPLQRARKGPRDAFVAKINTTTSVLVYSTYIGGSGSESANAIALDSQGRLYIGGETDSVDFRRVNAFQTMHRGKRDGFLMRLGPYGGIESSTFLGGAGDDRVTSLAISPNFTPFVAGCTDSLDFPTRLPWQANLNGRQDAFLTRFNTFGDGLEFSTYLGGGGGTALAPECANALAVDTAHNVYVAGVTPSKDFPVRNAFQNSLGGSSADGFVAKFDATGQAVYSSYLGGRGADAAQAITTDAMGRAYVTGYTASTNFPLVGPVQTAFGGVYDMFLVRVHASGGVLDFSTLYGGSSSDVGLALAVDGASIYVVGATSSANYPRQTPYQSVLKGPADTFLTKLAAF